MTAAICLLTAKCMLTSPLVLRLQVEQITQEQLEVVIADQEKPIVIDFFATWCGPCVMLAKELEKVGHNLTNAPADLHAMPRTPMQRFAADSSAD
jgi:thiol-disulfide isomerase/thioredoxin